MSDFDHDAWMERGAARQHAVEGALEEAYDFVSFQGHVSPAEALGQLAHLLAKGGIERQQGRPFDPSFEEGARMIADQLYKELTAQAESPQEAEAMVVALAERLFSGALGSARNALSEWESKTFRRAG
ncbi:hypothetical protein HYS79_01330 [Patescibacteria group bacterium]|nr:hypothetical protein [Patescibacteria group bacterium]